MHDNCNRYRGVEDNQDQSRTGGYDVERETIDDCVRPERKLKRQLAKPQFFEPLHVDLHEQCNISTISLCMSRHRVGLFRGPTIYEAVLALIAGVNQLAAFLFGRELL